MLCACSRGNSAEPGPDVLLVVIDTLRADRLGCYGYARPTSPRLDALAGSGVLFERVWAQSSWTLPSMSSMLTGRYYTAQRNRPEPEHPLLAESFRAAGYRTLGVTANSLLRPKDGFARGFEDYLVLADDAPFELVLERVDSSLVQIAADRARGGGRPFFLYLQPFDPHAPYERRPELDGELPPAQAPAVRPEGWQREELARAGVAPPEDDPEWQRALGALRRRRGHYDQEVRHTDAQLGRLLDRLDELGLSRNLVVAVVSDHGEGLWEQRSRMAQEELREAAPDLFFFQGHGQDLSEQALCTPFLLAGPGLPRGRRIDAPVENVDLFPTLLRLAGLPPPGELHGRDLLPLITGEVDSIPWRRERCAFVIRQVAVRDEASSWKLIVPSSELEQDRPPGAELYHLGQDPHEHVNRHADQPEVVADLLARAREFVRSHPTRRSRREEIDEELAGELRELGYSGDLFEDDP